LSYFAIRLTTPKVYEKKVAYISVTKSFTQKRDEAIGRTEVIIANPAVMCRPVYDCPITKQQIYYSIYTHFAIANTWSYLARIFNLGHQMAYTVLTLTSTKEIKTKIL
jgi:hypothetical protein